MPKVKARVLETKIEDGQYLAKLKFNRKLPPKGELLTCKWGSVRSLAQNNLYWKYLSWVVYDAGLKEQHGFYSPLVLHINLKEHFLAEKIFSKGVLKAIEEGTTTDMTISEFSEYFDGCDKLMMDVYEIDTSPFWDEYRESYAL